MKNLEESEIQQVGYYMSRFTDVAPEELDLVLEEFYRNSIMTDDGVTISSSPDFFKNTLTKALGADKAKEAGIPIVGGHSIDDKEPKYGLVVTGEVKEKKIWKNSGAMVGDACGSLVEGE